MAALPICTIVSPAQVNYVSRFALEKKSYLAGEPVFCDFTIQNTGSRTFSFSFRSPSRVLNRDLEQEPRVMVTDERGRPLPDPAPHPCGGAKGNVVYGSVSLPPGQTHTERWLLNEWARFSRPGRYRVRVERRLPLMALDPASRTFSERPSAYALAINTLTFELVPSTQAQLRSIFEPYLNVLDNSNEVNPAEAVTVVITLPQRFFVGKLETMAKAPARDRRWDRKQALEGLARLGTRDAWKAILNVAKGPTGDESLRAFAILLLAEKRDVAYLPALLEMIPKAPAGIRGDILRGLGFFNDTRSNEALFEALHSASPTDRMNAILGLKNLESRETIPALLTVLNDPDSQVRQVANFALQTLTGQRFGLSPAASREESERTARQWHGWWGENGTSFVPARLPGCHDW